MDQLILQTCNKIETLKQAGYEVIELWECDNEDLYNVNQTFKDMIDVGYTNLNRIRQRDNMAKTEYISNAAV